MNNSFKESLHAIEYSTEKRYNKGTLFSTKFGMITVSLQDIKSHGAKAIPDGKISYLIVNSKTKAVLVPPEEFEMLVEAMEELEDLKIIEERKNDKLLTWDQMFPKKKK